ncbi:MAG: adenylosuccinate lyase [Chloroflexi bacterium]|nr:adenylosuccinate lyase [Chloroflexota bacterium]
MYASPFSTRYGSDEMRAVWSETARRRTWRRIWLAVAEGQAAAGLVTPTQVEELRAHVDRIDLERAATLEAEIGHDVMAELRTYAEQCPQGGAILHWGLTSADVQDNADVARQRAALGLLLGRLRAVLLAFADQIDATSDLAVIGYTHMQAAEPTTLGYRLAVCAQDLLGHFEALARLRLALRGKGIRGAVGTGAPFVEMLTGTGITPEALEAGVLRTLGIEAHPIVTQTYPRVQDYQLVAALAALAASLHKFAFDLRLMQSPGLGTIAAEPFGERQVGSTAMPFKRNPVMAEQVCSLARLVASFTSTAWHNAADSLLERTLDDSANRRSILSEAFLASEQMLLSTEAILSGLQVDALRAAELLEAHGPFAATERLLSALVLAGGDRQAIHERLRQHTQSAWQAVRSGKPNPLEGQLTTDTVLLRYMQPARLRELLDARGYVGQAPERSRALARTLRQRLGVEEHG